ncbi:MAG: hypothetical protein HOH65_13415 [Rhodospirillaceae bacterium]|nr:hypothetical protein [Rhodospirillaceae bacterium]
MSKKNELDAIENGAAEPGKALQLQEASESAENQTDNTADSLNMVALNGCLEAAQNASGDGSAVTAATELRMIGGRVRMVVQQYESLH